MDVKDRWCPPLCSWFFSVFLFSPIKLIFRSGIKSEGNALQRKSFKRNPWLKEKDGVVSSWPFRCSLIILLYKHSASDKSLLALSFFTFICSLFIVRGWWQLNMPNGNFCVVRNLHWWDWYFSSLINVRVTLRRVTKSHLIVEMSSIKI